MPKQTAATPDPWTPATDEATATTETPSLVTEPTPSETESNPTESTTSISVTAPSSPEPSLVTEVTEPTDPKPITNTPSPEPVLWFGGSLVISATDKAVILSALDEILAATEPKYLLETSQGEGDMMIALNRPMISLLGATAIDNTVPRYFSADWRPERSLAGDRLQADEFIYAGAVQTFNGSGAKQVTESHRKIGDTLWLVTITKEG